MPLIVPGMMGAQGGDDKNSWMNKLVGKKIGESSDNTVRIMFFSIYERGIADHEQQTFAKKDLPQQHRVVKGDSMMTMDHNPDR